MDQAPNHPSPDSTLGKTPAAASNSPAISSWDEYYRAAARRRRAAGGRQNNIRVQKKRRLWRERIGISVAAIIVGALTMIFYLVLR